MNPAKETDRLVGSRVSSSQEEKLVSKPERRSAVRQRVPVVQPVALEYTAMTPATAPIADIGASGAFVITHTPLPAGTGLNYKLLLPSDPEPIKGQARVVREEQNLGMAVEFEGLRREDHERIKLFVASVLFKVPTSH